MNKLYLFLLTCFITTTLLARVPFTIEFLSDSTAYNDTITVQDSIVVNDSSNIKKQKPISIKPIYKESLFISGTNSPTILPINIKEHDYKYTGNILTQLPFSVLNDFGSMGTNNEIFLYGFGFDNISYLADDIGMNNRFNNSLDLHLFPSESISKVELLPLTRGFLINNVNNPVSVNFTTRDSINLIPFSRIRYLQAPNDEGFIDAIFSAYLMSRLNATVEISNMSKIDTYTNTEYGNWTAATKLRYMLSNSLNILLNYSHNSVRTPLNGGVDYESIASVYGSDSINEILFDELDAPVKYENRYLKSTVNNLSLQLLGNFLDNLPSTLSFYYQKGLNEFRQNETGSSSNIASILDDNKYNTYGIKYSQSLNTKYAELDVLAGYENTTLNSHILNGEKSYSTLSVAGVASLKLFENAIRPNVFAKYLVFDEESFVGFGSDITLAFTESINLYGGISGFAKPYSLPIKELIDSNNRSSKLYILEGGFHYEKNWLNLRFGFTSIKEDNKPFAIGNAVVDTAGANVVGGFMLKNVNKTSINLSANLTIWKVLFSTNASYYLTNDDYNLDTPDFTLSGGLYYKDILFEDALDLKTGLSYFLYGNRYMSKYDFQSSLSYRHIYNNTGSIVPLSNEMFSPDFRLDFFAAGTIQKLATLYFTAENILGTQYYIVPYYPMPGLTIRFGVSWEFFN